MKKILLVIVLGTTTIAGSAAAQVTGGGMMGGYAPLPQAQQNLPVAGYGMYPGLMGYGAFSHTMAYPRMMSQGWYASMMMNLPVPGLTTSAAEKKFFDETVELRKKAHLLVFEYA